MVRVARPSIMLVVSALLCTCGAPASTETLGANSLDLTVLVDAPNGGESLMCYGFDASAIATRTIASVHWSMESGSVYVHHAALYAIGGSYPTGPQSCPQVPPLATGLHIWAPGNAGLDLPPDMALALPAGTQSLVLQTHAIRTQDGPAIHATASVGLFVGTPARVASFVGANADVPSIAPHASATAGTNCPIGAASHTVLVWPHMHEAGTSFHASVVHQDGTRTALVDVVPWVFDAQQMYPVEVDLAPGDLIATSCSWQNTTDAVIEPGPLTENEMCTFGVLLWPSVSAQWGGPCFP